MSLSLVTYQNSNKSEMSGRVSEDSRAQSKPGHPSTYFHRVRAMLAATGRLIVTVYAAIGEARLQKAMIEAELYRNRYMHTSKNDDDLPIVQ